MRNNIRTQFDVNTKTLYITGSGNISWKDTVEFADGTEHVVIKGDSIFCTNGSNLFANFESLIDIEGTIDTSACQDMSFFYSRCLKLIKPISNLDTSSAEEFDFFHDDNLLLTSVTFNSTASGRKFNSMFRDCKSLTSITGVTIPSDYNVNTISENPFIIALLSKMTTP